MKALLALIFIASSCSAMAWSLFGPSDFEECQVQAAKDAKNRDALNILISKCDADFPARKKIDGKYHYFDRVTNSYIDVSGPKLSKRDTEIIANARKAHLEGQAEFDKWFEELRQQWAAKNREALAGLSVVTWNVRCTTDYYCGEKLITATVKNSSKHTVKRIEVGWTLTSGNVDCNANVRKSSEASVQIPPGQRATLSWKTYDGPDSRVTGCFGIVSGEVE